jgi:hypothetical protein
MSNADQWRGRNEDNFERWVFGVEVRGKGLETARLEFEAHQIFMSAKFTLTKDEEEWISRDTRGEPWTPNWAA